MSRRGTPRQDLARKPRAGPAAPAARGGGLLGNRPGVRALQGCILGMLAGQAAAVLGLTTIPFFRHDEFLLWAGVAGILLALTPARGMLWVISGALLLEYLQWFEAAGLVNRAVEKTFAESEEIAHSGPGKKLYVTYDIARQFPGYTDKDGASSSQFAERIIHHVG